MNTNSGLKINVGFLVHEELGTEREYLFDFPALKTEDGLQLKNVHIDLNLSKTQIGLIAAMEIVGVIEMECSRCLEPISHRIQTDFSEVFVFRKKEVSEDAILIPEDHMIDFNPIVTEYIDLAQPLHVLCKEDCKGLCVECGANLNKEDCGHEQVSIDPRFAKLRDLLVDGDEDED